MQEPQQTGIPPIIMTACMPIAIIFFIISPADWIIAAVSLSPEVQQIFIPSSVFSMRQQPIIPIDRLIMGIPLVIIMTVGAAPIVMSHMACIIPHIPASSHEQVIIMPPSIFSIFM